MADTPEPEVTQARDRLNGPGQFGVALAAFATVGALLLTGCGVSSDIATTSQEIAGRQVQGKVHGGVFPIQGATVRLMETQSNGYGGAAVQLLSTTSDANGAFNFPDAGWSCTQGQFLYLTVTSGYTVNLSTTTNNNDVVQVGVIGPCSDLYSGSTFSSSKVDAVNLYVSELSTIAAAYALGNFITVDDTNASTGQQIVNISAPPNNNAGTVSPATTANPAGPVCSGTGSSMSCTASGLAHGFQNAVTLVDSVRLDGSTPTGNGVSSNPTFQPVSGKTTSFSALPLPLLNTMGNILQSCVDSVGGGSCSSLFAATKKAASATDTNCASGTAPANTLEAVLNMAKYPTCQLSNRFALQPSHEFFTPDMSAAPTSFTLSIFYGVGTSGNDIPYPVDIALDASDNAFILYANENDQTGATTEVKVLGPDGSNLFDGSNANYGFPSQIAVDNSGNVYVTNDDTSGTTGALLRANYFNNLAPVATLNQASGVAVDSNNNVWVSADNTTGASISEFTSSSLASAQSSGNVATAAVASKALQVPVVGISIDANENIWGVTNSTSSATVVVLPNTAASGSTATYASSGGGLTASLAYANGFGVGFDSSGTAYMPIKGYVQTATYSSSAGLKASTSPVAASGSNSPRRTEMDGGGNLFWADDETAGNFYMYSSTTGSVIDFLPCYPYPTTTTGGYKCLTTTQGSNYYTPSNLRGLAIDSTGDIWFAADAGYGAVIEMLGLASPTWPLQSYGHPGVKPQ